MNFLGSRNNFLPKSPLLQRIACYIRRFRRYSLMFSLEFVPIAFTIPYHRCILMDNYLHLSFIHSSPVDLVITRCTEILSIVPRIFCAYCLTDLCRMNTPMDNSSHLSSIRSFPVVHVFRKRLWNTIRSSKNSEQPIALEILTCLHYG